METADLSIVERAVSAALERLAHENAQTAQFAREHGEKADAKFFQRAANAYVRALGYYLAGIRPTPTTTGWMLPSQRAGEPPHLLHLDGDWRCTCQAGDTMHWASALVIGIEVAGDDMERFDDGPEEIELPSRIEATIDTDGAARLLAALDDLDPHSFDPALEPALVESYRGWSVVVEETDRGYWSHWTNGTESYDGHFFEIQIGAFREAKRRIDQMIEAAAELLAA